MAVLVGTIFPIAFFIIFNVNNIDFKEYLHNLFVGYEIVEEFQNSSIFIKLSWRSNYSILTDTADQTIVLNYSLNTEEDRKINEAIDREYGAYQSSSGTFTLRDNGTMPESGVLPENHRYVPTNDS